MKSLEVAPSEDHSVILPLSEVDGFKLATDTVIRVTTRVVDAPGGLQLKCSFKEVQLELPLPLPIPHRSVT